MDGPRDMVPPGQGSRCRALRRLVPVGFGAEARTLFVLSGPLFLFQMLNFMTYVVSTVFCGHLGKVELAAVTLSVAFVNVCGVSIGFGLSSACDTLMSQSFGSPNRTHVGVILQRGALALLLCCLPCWALFLNTQHILLLCRQDPAVSRMAQEYVHAYIPALPPAGQISAKSGHRVAPSPQRRRGQLRQRAGQLHPGFRAGPGGQFTQAVFLLLCIVKKKLHLDTWAGWSSQCLQDWGPFFRLAVPSMLMTCIEWWAYEIGSFLMGLLSVLDLSAQAIIYEVATVVYMIPMGLSIAVCFRVGTALGAADTVQAKRSAVSGTLCTVGTSLVVGTVLSLLRNKLGRIFTNDEEVVALVSKVLPLYVVFHLFEAVCCLYGGVLRGTGRQAFGAVVNAVAYYVVGLPLGAVLTFVVGLGITGLWLGMLACVFLAAAAFVTSTAWMDWKRAAEEVQKRVGLPPQAAESAAPSLRPGPERVVVSSVATGSYPGVTLTTYSRPEAHLDLFGTPEAAQPLPAPPGRLSAKQLAIRRGAALGAATGTLVVGLVIRVLTARP
ncbi:multidrug and toxin extrusion protein 2 isoform X1 [Balaenoptera ricei]|uniref:multidrug and toxin extrusion protein 2 isoform X1 n=1 Tax=Balaenoptera ricei TaxID=2746895 RepID=UPI0028BDDE7D|nr:multidrug and toxin extrusion protein 2 isoform X1 [Balaenoptera ricei]